MKIKKIAAVLKDRGVANIYDRLTGDGVAEQWIGSGSAFYPVGGLPWMNVEHLPVLLDLSPKQAKDMAFTHESLPGCIDVRDTPAEEWAGAAYPVTIKSAGDELVAVRARDKVWFLDRALLEPILAEYEEPEYWLRGDKIKYFAIKAGLMVVGVVLPMTKMGAVADICYQIGSGYRDERGPEA